MNQTLFYTHFPYCIQHLCGDRYIILNRNYKPLGQTSFEYVDYDKDPSVVRMKITTKQAEKLSYKGKVESDTIWLYDNIYNTFRNPQVFNDYVARLKLLATMTPKNVF